MNSILCRAISLSTALSFTLCGVMSAEKPSSQAPSSGLVAPGDFIWGMNGHPPSGGGTYSDDRGVPLSEQLRLLKELGVTWYRFDVFARDRVPGVWEGRDELDAIVPVTEAAGIKILPTLYPPMEMRPYATLHQRMKREEIYKKCYEHAKTAAAKWRGRVKVWDLLNEPDNGARITQGDPVSLEELYAGEKLEDYDPGILATVATILKAQADGIRAGDPAAKISMNMGGGLNTAFLDYMIEHGVSFDILQWHHYGFLGPFKQIKTAGGLPLLDKLLGYGKPLWIGEFNAPPLDYHGSATRSPHLPKTEKERGEILARDASAFYERRADGLEAVFFYELLNLPAGAGDPSYGFIGLVETDGPDGKKHYKLGEKLPIYETIRKLILTLNEKQPR